MTQPPRKKGPQKGGHPAGKSGGTQASKGPAPSRRGGLPKLNVQQKRLVALVLGLALVLTFTGFALGPGLGGGSLPAPDAPDDLVAEVEGIDGGEITLEQFDVALARTATQAGLPADDLPKPGQKGFDELLSSTLQNMLLPIWAEGEAEELGITPSEDEIVEKIDEAAASFGSDAEFQTFLLDEGYCTSDELGVEETSSDSDSGGGDEKEKKQGGGDESGGDGGGGGGEEEVTSTAGPGPEDCQGVRREIGLIIFLEQIQEDLGPGNPEEAAAAVDADLVETVYDQNIESFSREETRDARVILTADPEDAEAAYELLSEDDSSKTWEEAVEKYSIAPASAPTGVAPTTDGLVTGITEGSSQYGPTFEEAVFSAEKGELLEPFETGAGTFVVQVDKITEGEVTPLGDVNESCGQRSTSVACQIRTQLAAQDTQEAAAEFRLDFVRKWSQRTVCAEGYAAPGLCENAEPAELCPKELSRVEGCIGQAKYVGPAAVYLSTPGAPAPSPGTGAYSAIPGPAPPQVFDGEELAANGCTVNPAPPWISVTLPSATGQPQLPDTALPQHPNTGVEECAAPAAPPGGGLVPGVPGGTVPGAVPPTGVPPTGAPPTGAPPTGAPPGAVPVG